MPKLKVLPPERWMLTDRWITDELRIDRDSRAKKVKPVYLRLGIYLKGDKCWFENGTGAWTYAIEHFRYKLDILEAERISDMQVKALQVIVDAKLATKHQKRLLQLCRQVAEMKLANMLMRRHVMRIRARLKKFKENK